MTLQLSGQIASEDISGVKKLDRVRPVYLLADDGGKVVVKRDNTPHAADPRNMRTALRNMKIIDRTMATRQLTSSEIQALSQCVELKRLEAEMFNSPLAADVASLSQDLDVAGGVAWVKTNFFDGLVNLESAAAMVLNEGKKTGIKAIAAALNLPGGFEKLGQILAVDAFNGNDDRFSFSNARVVPQCRATPRSRHGPGHCPAQDEAARHACARTAPARTACADHRARLGHSGARRAPACASTRPAAPLTPVSQETCVPKRRCGVGPAAHGPRRRARLKLPPQEHPGGRHGL